MKELKSQTAFLGTHAGFVFKGSQDTVPWHDIKNTDAPRTFDGPR